ncbi:interleukin-22 receptor subunit alpha-2 [Octodon degus]|uniref:Interleukin-22 receptor subunit alpha-2 n=1 Tax=Octodon degus TaxID=10160 RepID=A0A6P3F1Y4_OCTDE|nr:interleukin-22 receptor subunit alpha-2 [Octodon degus]
MVLEHCFLGFLLGLLPTGGVGTQPTHNSLKPQRVRFQSQNFHNVLLWQPGQALATNRSIYFVQYKVYGESEWKSKEECWGTQELFCDLTNETSELQEPYYGRVRTSHSGWSTTSRFIPWWETKIEPPVINITRVNGSLSVVIRAPDLPYRHQKGKMTSVENYYELEYRVFIIKNSLKMEKQVYEGPRRVVEIEALIPPSGACIVAELYMPRLYRGSPRSAKRCVGGA